MIRHKQHILFVCTEDWFFRSHFMPLHDATLLDDNFRTSIICNTGSARPDLEAAGLRVLPVAFSRESNNPLSALKLLWQLARYISEEKPDIIHFISLKPMMLGGLVSLVRPKSACVYHLTGLGYLTVSEQQTAHYVRKIFLKLTNLYMKRRNSWLVLENPDDQASVAGYGALDETRLSIFGGAGVDPEVFSVRPDPKNPVPVAAFVGRMVWSKGVDVLLEAMALLKARGTGLHLDLYGSPDKANPRAIPLAELEALETSAQINWHGRVTHLEAIWAGSDFCVVPSRGGEGLPRALLEAASCGKPLIVTDVPGNRYFVRDGVEGFVIPPNDPEALAEAMAKLATDPDLRQKMGTAARTRILEGFTEKHVHKKLLHIYQKLLK